jgi:hypothetical protein
MHRFRFLVVSLVLLLFGPSAHSQVKGFAAQSAEQLKAGIEDKHPSVYYALAAKLLNQEKKTKRPFGFISAKSVTALC